MHLFRKTLPALTLLAASACGTPLRAAQKAVLQDAVAGSQQVSFSVYLPLQHRSDLEQLLSNLHTSTSATYQHWLTPAEFNQRFAASAESVQAIQSQLSASNLTSTRLSPHYLRVTGSASDVERAFATKLRTGVFPNGRKQVVAATAVTPPSTISSLGGVVTGLSGTIRMKSHAHRVTTSNRYSPEGDYWFDDLKQAYQWPSYTSYNGKGVTIGILIDGDYNPPDMDLYFKHEKLATPNFSEVKVLGGAPFDPDGDSFETHLDMQQTGGTAPLANVVVYNIPDLSDDSIMAGLSQILEDNKTDVVSMSFGGPEVYYTAAYNGGDDLTYYLRAEDDLFAQGNAQGITFIASSGDGGALDALPVSCFYEDTCTGTFQPSVQFPASSPHVVGVGGTNLKTTYTAGNLNSAYISEEAFADPLTQDIFYGTDVTGGYWGSGGGNSVLFPKPLYQRLVNTGSNSVRTVPDVAGHMGGCPGGAICNADDSADIEVIAGKLYGAIGTSASAPDFAGLTALAVQRYGTRLGNENYYIYALAALQNTGLPLVKAFHTGIPGFNGLYSTTASGYNRVLGNGTVIGKQFLLAPLVPSAGIPQTTSNP